MMMIRVMRRKLEPHPLTKSWYQFTENDENNSPSIFFKDSSVTRSYESAFLLQHQRPSWQFSYLLISICPHLRWSSPPRPYPSRARSWRSCALRGSRRRSPCPRSTRTSSQTGSRSPGWFPTLAFSVVAVECLDFREKKTLFRDHNDLTWCLCI